MFANNETIELINNRLEGIGKPLYITKFGAELYGLSTKNSDHDYVCVFLPNKENLLLDGYTKNIHHFHYQSKKDNSEKNTPNDVDIKFVSIQELLYRLNNLEVEACDILYSFTNKDTVIFKYDYTSLGWEENVFDKRKYLLDISNQQSFIGYGINQVKKYGLKGTKVDIIERLKTFLENTVFLKEETLGEYVKPLLCFNVLPEGSKNTLWEIKLDTGDKKDGYLRLFDSLHMLHISMEEFQYRINRLHDKYGKRSELAKQNQGIDWKAASYGLRSLINYKKLITIGDFSYPFVGEEKKLLMDVKKGKMLWSDYENTFMTLYNEICSWDKSKINSQNSFDRNEAKRIIHDLYDAI